MRLDDIERDVWKQIQSATEARDTQRLAVFGPLAAEIEARKKDWIARLEHGLKTNGSSVRSVDDHFPSTARVSVSHADNFTGRPIVGFEFEGTEVRVTTYKDLLVRFANVLRGKYGDEFDRRAKTLGGRKRRYFSASATELKHAHPLDGGGLYVETNLNANLIVQICRRLVAEFGSDPGTLKIR